MDKSNPAEIDKNGSFLNKTARVISTLFVPPALTIIIFTYFAFSLEAGSGNATVIVTVSYTFGFIFQILMFLYFRQKGKIADQDASVKEERTIPMLTAVMIYLTGLIVLILCDINITVTAFWSCYITHTLLVIWINRYWKISAHAGGVAGPLAALTFVAGAKAFPFFILFPIVGWARLRLRQHTLMQIIAGGLLGFVITYLQIYLIHLISRNV